jgi:hypothetical protein
VIRDSLYALATVILDDLVERPAVLSECPRGCAAPSGT